MKRTFVLCTASLLILGYVTLVASFESSDDFMSLCGINNESDGTLIACLEKQNDDIEKEMSSNPIDRNRIKLLLRKNLECFDSTQVEKKMCYRSVFKSGLNPNKSFSANYISLFLWFQRNTNKVLSACGMTETNSVGVLSCIANIEKEAGAIIRKREKNCTDTYSEMVRVINKAIFCYGSVTPTQAECLLNQTEVLKTSFTKQIDEARNKMKETLSNCELDQEQIKQTTECIESVDAKLIDLSFRMLNQPELSSEVQSLWEKRGVCIKLQPDAMKCLKLSPLKRSRMFNLKNPFPVNAITELIRKSILRSSRLVLRMCKIRPSKNASVDLCLDETAKAYPGVNSNDSKTAFMESIKLVNASAKCFDGISKSEKSCLCHNKKLLFRIAYELLQSHFVHGIRILRLCDATSEMNLCVRRRMMPLLDMLRTMIKNPSSAEDYINLANNLQGCMDDDPIVKQCVVNIRLGEHMSSKRSGIERLNFFDTDAVVRVVVNTINKTTSTIGQICSIPRSVYPEVYTCMKDKESANPDINSNDTRTAFIAMIKFVNESAQCFEALPSHTKICLRARMERMRKFLRTIAAISVRIALQGINLCNGDIKMKTCVRNKSTQLLRAGMAMWNSHSIAGQVFDLASSSKTCLDEDENIKKCVLKKVAATQSFPNGDNSQMSCNEHEPCAAHQKKKNYFTEKLMGTLADCQVADEMAKDVVNCLKDKDMDMKKLYTKDYKKMFSNGMKFMKAFDACLQNLPEANKLCISNKKKEMMDLKIKKMEGLLDKFLGACGATESGKPELFKCLQPKRTEMKTLLAQLFGGNAVSADLWNSTQDMKKCFANEPQIKSCFHEKSMNYYISKVGKYFRGNSMGDICCKINKALHKCNVTETTTPDLHFCMQYTFHNGMALFSRKDIDSATLAQNLKQMKGLAMRCIEDADDKTKKCLKKESESLKSRLSNFRKSAFRFDKKAMMDQTDKVSAKCNITVKNTPTLKKCLDTITLAVMEIKPWQPMDDKTREQLKLEGDKYWKCFKGIHQGHKQCMLNMVESFSKKDSSYYDKLINTVASKCKECVENQCFQTEVEYAAKIYKEYIKAVLAKEKTDSIEERFRMTVVKASICLLKLPKTKKYKTFVCLAKVKKATFKILEIIAKSGTGNGLLTRKRRDADEDENEDADADVTLDIEVGDVIDDDGFDGDEFDFDDVDDNMFNFVGNDTNFTFFSFMRNDEAGNGPQSTASVMQIMYGPQSVDRVNTMFNLMKTFISTCTEWSPTPEAIRSSELYEKPEAVPQIDPDYIKCQKMYDDINSFIDTGEEQKKYLSGDDDDDDDDDRKSSRTSALFGGIAGGVIVSAVIVPIFIIICVMKKGRCSRSKPSPACVLACRPTPISSVCSTMPEKQPAVGQMPPSYIESVDEERMHKSIAGLSQILDSSTGESTEKSC